MMNSLSTHQPHNFWRPAQTKNDSYQFSLLQVKERTFRESIVKLQQCCTLKVVHYRHYTLLLDNKLYIRAALSAPSLAEHELSRETQYLLTNDNTPNNSWCRAPLPARIKYRFLSLNSNIRKISHLLLQATQLGKQAKLTLPHRTLAKKIAELEVPTDSHWHTLRLTN